jgi:cobalt/nickel transport system permease protein
VHIPDGWLSLEISLLTWALVLVSLGLALSHFDKSDLDKLSNIGAIASVVFVAQMFNFPVAGGTSGHLLGAALSVYVVGLPGAVLTLFVVLLVQAVVFADGGILALGANTFNMGVVGSITAYVIIKLFPNSLEIKNRRSYLTGVFLSSFIAVLLSSFFAGIELVLSGQVDFATSIPLILFWHLLIGIGEGIISVFVIIYMLEVDFPLNNSEIENVPLLEVLKESNKPMIGLGVLLLLLSTLAIFASSSPDGLEYVGIDLSLPKGNSFSAGIVDDYQFLNVNSATGTFLSALLGTIIILGVFLLPSIYIREKRELSSA